MKKYMLKKRYPSLYEDIEEGIEVEYKDGWIYYVNTRGNKACVEFDPNEFIFTDFWEEVKPPLFVTEDGVEVFDQEDVYYVTDKLEKINSFINWFTIESMAKDTKIFKHESSADEYIWRNKKVFSYEEMKKANIDINWCTEDIYYKAKERIEQ